MALPDGLARGLLFLAVSLVIGLLYPTSVFERIAVFTSRSRFICKKCNQSRNGQDTLLPDYRPGRGAFACTPRPGCYAATTPCAGE